MRISDAGKVTAAAIRSGLISLASTKTAEPTVAAVAEELRLAFLAYEEACVADRRPIGGYALGGANGKPLHKRTLAKDLADALEAAGWPDGKSAHALRYAAAIRLHELGWTVDRIKLITGHRMAAMAEKYIAKKREAPVVKEAVDRIDAAQAAALIAGPPARRTVGGATAPMAASSPGVDAA
jgi:integrase